MSFIRTLFVLRFLRMGVAIAIGLVLLYWLFLARPGWYADAGDRSPEAASVGAGLEQAISREITMVREPGEWGFLLGQAEINAWLVNRLEPWLESREGIELPQGVSDPRVLLGDGWIEVGLLSRQIGVPIFISARFEPRLDGRFITLTPIGGRMAFKELGEGALAYLADYARLDDRTEVGASGSLRVPATIELMDGRRVLLKDFEVLPGELGLRFQTLGG